MTYTLEDLIRLISKHNFCILATEGRDGPRAAGMGYFSDGLDIYIPTKKNTAHARNLHRNKCVGISIPVPYRLLPAPPRSIQYQGIAEILHIKDPAANEAFKKASFILRRMYHKHISNKNKHYGDSIWIKIRPVGRIQTFLIGVPMVPVIRDEFRALLYFDVPEQEE